MKSITSSIAAALLLASITAVPLMPAAAPAQDAAVQEAVASSREELIKKIEDKFDDERFFNAHWGVLIQSLDDDEVWLEINADKLFLPASNEKILTTAAALLYLGPDFKYETKVCHTGEINGDTLEGDLVVYANGDPTLYDRWLGNSTAVFEDWAGQLKQQGITAINGRIIGDDNAWNDEHTGSGWPFDELTPWYYAEYGPLNFNENYVDIDIVPPETVDGEVKLVPNVESSYYTLINKIKVVEEGSNNISMYRPIGENTITLSGTVVAGSKTFEETPTITNPTLWYVHVLKEVLEANGIEVTGAPTDVDDIDGWDKDVENLDCLITHYSPPLSEILIMLMKRSQNMFAETMVYTMGWKAQGKGTFSNGRRVVQEQLKKMGIDPSGYNFSDGSGLSRYNYISPRIIATIYDKMLETKYANVWWDAQSIAGVDGTMARRMRDTPAQANVRGKTGRINAVRACSGYVATAGGERLVYSFQCNGHQRASSEVDEIYDAVLVMLASFDEPASNGY